MTATRWPECATPDCEGRIYFRPETRKVCRACELRGLAPETELPALPAAKEQQRG